MEQHIERLKLSGIVQHPNPSWKTGRRIPNGTTTVQLENLMFLNPAPSLNVKPKSKQKNHYLAKFLMRKFILKNYMIICYLKI